MEYDEGLLGRPYGPTRPALRALGRVLGDLSDLGFDAEVVGLRAADAGAPHSRFRVFVLAYAPSVGRGEGWTEPARLIGRSNDALGGAPAGLTLLPTPAAHDSGNTPEEHLRKKPGRKVVTSLQVMADHGLIANGGQLLPTPQAHDAQKGKTPEQVSAMRARGHGVANLNETIENRLLPTPTTQDAANNGGPSQFERNTLPLNTEVLTFDGGTWGPYAEAIARWEDVMGRPAPAPTLPDGKGGKHRLNARLVEWMMGQPDGWVTAPEIGLTRNEHLKALGNGVVTQQATLAMSIAWSRVLEAVAA